MATQPPHVVCYLLHHLCMWVGRAKVAVSWLSSWLCTSGPAGGSSTEVHMPAVTCHTKRNLHHLPGPEGYWMLMVPSRWADSSAGLRGLSEK